MTFQDRVGQWAEKTFTKATDQTVLTHMKREMVELEESVAHGNLKPELAEECADIYLLLLHLAHRNKFDLQAFAKRKHEVNTQRLWGAPDAEGVVEHIKEPR